MINKKQSIKNEKELIKNNIASIKEAVDVYYNTTLSPEMKHDFKPIFFRTLAQDTTRRFELHSYIKKASK